MQLLKPIPRHVRLAAVFAGLALVDTAALLAQAQSQGGEAKLPRFEVASVRPSNPNREEINGFYTYPGGRIVARGCNAIYLIMVAFNVQEFQISGGPDWISLTSGDRFDVQAKPSESSLSAGWETSSPKIYPGLEERQMLQTLLAERFHFRFHRGTKEGAIFILAKGSKELKLTPPKDTNSFPWAGGISGGWFAGGMRGENISIRQLTERLSGFLRRPVLDQTGIEGSFDFEFPTGTDDNDSDIPTFLVTAMKGIGLSLKPSRGPVETIFIDHIERPSPN
jgi:bla regulator protein BlaR1